MVEAKNLFASGVMPSPYYHFGARSGCLCPYPGQKGNVRLVVLFIPNPILPVGGAIRPMGFRSFFDYLDLGDPTV